MGYKFLPVLIACRGIKPAHILYQFNDRPSFVAFAPREIIYQIRKACWWGRPV